MPKPVKLDDLVQTRKEQWDATQCLTIMTPIPERYRDWLNIVLHIVIPSLSELSHLVSLVFGIVPSISSCVLTKGFLPFVSLIFSLRLPIAMCKLVAWKYQCILVCMKAAWLALCYTTKPCMNLYLMAVHLWVSVYGSRTASTTNSFSASTVSPFLLPIVYIYSFLWVFWLHEEPFSMQIRWYR